MWLLVRMLALMFLVTIGALVGGHGGRLFAVLDAFLGLVGASTVARPPPSPSPLSTLGGLAVGCSVALIRPVHRAVGQVVTLLHELGHTVVAAALGGRPRGIVLRHDASGHATAEWVGRASPFRRLALATVAFAGLPAAAAASASGVQLLSVAGPRMVLWSVAVAGVLVGLLARSAWSLLIATGTAGLAVAGLGDTAEPWAASAVVAILTAIAVKSTGDDLRRMRSPIRRGDDARVVADHLRLPARPVRFAQVAVGGVLSGHALWWLLRPVYAG